MGGEGGAGREARVEQGGKRGQKDFVFNKITCNIFLIYPKSSQENDPSISSFTN